MLFQEKHCFRNLYLCQWAEITVGKRPVRFCGVLLIILLAVPGCGSESTPSDNSSASAGGGSTSASADDSANSTSPKNSTSESSAAAESVTAPETAALTIEAPVVKSPIPGISLPVLVSAAEATLADEAMVIGVVAGNESRAYAVEALEPEDSHVINDLIQKIPVTITYCPVTKAVRVFSTSESQEPVPVSSMSTDDKGLSLILNGTTYEHSSNTIPLTDMDFVQTAWIAWKTEHPDARVFQGKSPDKPLPDRPASAQ